MFLPLQRGQCRGKRRGRGRHSLRTEETLPAALAPGRVSQGRGMLPIPPPFTCHCVSAEPGARSPTRLSGGRNKAGQRTADPEKQGGAGDFSHGASCTRCLYSHGGHPPPPLPLKSTSMPLHQMISSDSGGAVPLNRAFPDPAQMVSLFNGGAEGAFRATEQECPMTTSARGQRRKVRRMERDTRILPLPPTPKPSLPEPPRLGHHCGWSPLSNWDPHCILRYSPPILAVSLPKHPRLTTHKMRLRTSTVGIPPKGCPWRTVLRDWKHSFTVMLWGFVFKASGEEDILGTLRLPVWWKVSDSGKAPHSAKHRKM